MRRFDDASSSCITMKFNKFSQKIIHPGRGKDIKSACFFPRKNSEKFCFTSDWKGGCPLLGMDHDK